MPRRSAFRSVRVIGLILGASTLALAPVLADGRHRREPPIPITQRTLRELAQPIGLRIGTAVDMNALTNDQTYRDTIAREFSSVTAENVMKWETLEPQQGVEPCLLTRGCDSFTVWGYTDKYSWVPGFFTGEGAADLLDENFQPKPALAAVQHDLALAGMSRR